MYKTLCLIIQLALLPCISIAQDVSVIDPTLTPRQDVMMNNQAAYMLHVADSVLEAYPPKISEPLERSLALYLLDCVFHDVYAPMRMPVQEYVQHRLERAASDIESTTVRKGAVIWKIYSHSFVVKTPTVCIAMDLVRPSVRFDKFYTDQRPVMEWIIGQCDVLFVSHWHPDHADAWVAQMFIDENKPVIAPPGVWEEAAFSAQVLQPERNPAIRHQIPLAGQPQALEVVIYPGHQGDFLNNVPVIYTPEGICFSHTGDQNAGHIEEDTVWLDYIHLEHHLDFLLYNPYMRPAWIKGFDPDLVISAHENELGHGIHSRHPFWRMHQRAAGIAAPVMVLSWGESYHYLPDRFSNQETH